MFPAPKTQACERRGRQRRGSARRWRSDCAETGWFARREPRLASGRSPRPRRRSLLDARDEQPRAPKQRWRPARPALLVRTSPGSFRPRPRGSRSVATRSPALRRPSDCFWCAPAAPARSRTRGAGRLLTCCRRSRRDDRNATIAIACGHADLLSDGEGRSTARQIGPAKRGWQVRGSRPLHETSPAPVSETRFGSAAIARGVDRRGRASVAWA
jgi:hypothetical protein